MGGYKLRIKIGQHEFEAEGERDEVEKDLALFKEIIADTKAADSLGGGESARRTENPLDGTSGQPYAASARTSNQGSATGIAGLSKIFGVEPNSPISLTALPQGDRREKDAVLLLLLGYREFRQEEAVNGIQLLEGIKKSGYNLDRVDRIVHTYVNSMEPLITTVGKRRGLQYRLTNRGFARAREIAEELIRMVA